VSPLFRPTIEFSHENSPSRGSCCAWPVRGHAELAATVAVLLVGEVELPVIAALAHLVVELARLGEEARAEAGELRHLAGARRVGGVLVGRVVPVAHARVDEVLALLDLERVRVDVPLGHEGSVHAVPACDPRPGRVERQLVVHEQLEVAAARTAAGAESVRDADHLVTVRGGAGIRRRLDRQERGHLDAVGDGQDVRIGGGARPGPRAGGGERSARSRQPEHRAKRELGANAS
jgi:hypothetical protein